MAKHIYHIPLQKALTFIRTHKKTLSALTTDTHRLEYYAHLGKSYYTLELEAFITFLKIDREISYALKTVEYFTGKPFIDTLSGQLNFAQFEHTAKPFASKTFFYAFCYLYHRHAPEAFAHLLEKSFLHYHTTLHQNTPIRIDYRDMSHTLAKSRHLTIKESFGDDEKKGAFFTLSLEGISAVEMHGKSIKTLRKKAYKELFYQLVEMGEEHSEDEGESEAHALLDAYKGV